MARAPRRLPLRITAGFFAFVFWLPSLAVGDLVIGLLPDSSASSHAAGNLAYGVIGAVLIAPAFATLTRRPERKIAPLQQIALVIVALACAAVASGSGIGIAGAAVVLVSLLVVVALHPERRDVLRRPRRPSAPLLGLGVVAVVPALAYAWKNASNGRADLPPEMLEAIGKKEFPTYFATIDRLLAQGGLACVQTILIPDDRYDRYRKSPDWIEQYIFPGALIPSLGALASASKRASRLMLSEVHEIGPNYAETLRRWRENFDAQIEEVRALGYDKRFERTWHFCLAFCEAGFRA